MSVFNGVEGHPHHGLFFVFTAFDNVRGFLSLDQAGEFCLIFRVKDNVLRAFHLVVVVRQCGVDFSVKARDAIGGMFELLRDRFPHGREIFREKLRVRLAHVIMAEAAGIRCLRFPAGLAKLSVGHDFPFFLVYTASTDMRTSFYQYTLPELRKLFAENGHSPSAADKLYNWYYKKFRDEGEVPDISKAARAFIAERIFFTLPDIHTVQSSAHDRTVKFLFKLSDGRTVETVLIPSNKRYGICLSSQVGCAMKCSFCHTGLQGLERHLGPHEIVGQFMAAKKWLEANRPDDQDLATIVFMGQGEPLHNFDSVKSACGIFLSQNGLCLAADKITISTAGFLPGLQRWKEEMPSVNIALSLHSVDHETRSKLIPINEAYPLSKVLAAIDEIPTAPNRFVVYEYLLVKEMTDTIEDARKLGELLKGKRAFVNLIPFNAFPGGKYERPSEERVDAFKRALDETGVTSLVRFTKGDDILAACGQLNSKGS